MRRLNFTPPNDEAWRKWRKSCEAARHRALEAAARGERPNITDLYKKSRAVYFDPMGPFRGKCAYCEQEIVSNQHGDIEHFRPKSAVAELDHTLVTRIENGKTIQHPGYYWLAYDWENLLPACVLCNQVPAGRAYGKGIRFPVRGHRSWAPGGEAGEEPELLNPLVDDPSVFMEFDPATGLLVGRNKRGLVTIEMLGLNLRELPRLRLNAYQDGRAAMCRIMIGMDTEGGGVAAQKLADLMADERRDFTSVRRAAYTGIARDWVAATAVVLNA